MITNRKIVVEFSGGADSTLALLLAHKKFPSATIHPIFIHYGEKYNDIELINVKQLMTKWEWIQPLKVVKIDGLNTSKIMPHLPEYIPIRNTVLSVIACQYASSIGAFAVINGSKGQVKIYDDPYSFFDSTVPHYKLVQSAVNYAQEEPTKLQVISMLAENRRNYMTKKEVYQQLLQLGIGLYETYSCYKDNKPFCECPNCVQKEQIRTDLENDPNYKPFFKKST